jgi:hypothetical protein
MSTLAVTNIQSQSSGTLPSFQDSGGVERGRLCRAFVNFDGTTSPGTIRSSFNVSSVTKNGTGDYTVNFTNALADANYSVVATSGVGVGDVTRIAALMSSSTSGVRLGTGVRDSATNIPLDANFMNAVIFR